MPHPVRVYLAVVVSLLLTVSAWYFAKTSFEFYDAARFEAEAKDIHDEISFQMQTYVNALVQTKSTFVASQEVTREEFRDYVASMRLLEQYPGAQGVAYTVRIAPAQRQRHVAAVRRSGLSSYHLWPEGVRDEYFSVLYIEPFDWRNQHALGYDMYTEATRRSAMEMARDSGGPVMSGKVTLVQETLENEQPGFLIYVPLYQKGAALASVAERHAALQGFIYSPFRTRDLFLGMFPDRPNTVDFEVYDGATIRPESLMYNFDGKPHFAEPDFAPHFQKRLTFKVAERPWTMLIYTLPAFELGWYRYAPAAVLIIGIIFSLLVFAAMRANYNEIEASRHTTRLSEVLETIHRVGQTLSAELDLEKLTQSIIDAATQLSGAEFGALFYNVAGESGEEYLLYSLSGVTREAFANVPMPRTEVLRPTFHGEGAIRSDDITQDPRYGKNVPDHGMPPGQLPVKSYLAVPVVSRAGDVLGGLFFGHSDAGVFSERAEKLVAGLAAQAAIAIDNARLYQKAQEAIRARDEFLSIASHELKTPITSLKLQLQMTQRVLEPARGAGPVADRIGKFFEVSARQIERLTNLVENLLDVSRIGAGRLRFSYESVDLAALTRSVVEHFAEPMKIAGGTVTLEADEPVMVSCDRFRIEQVITNLLTNAIKYGAGRPIRISVRASSDAAGAILEFEDHGIGIEKNKQSKIFERFQRAVSHTNISGLGLGLYITKQIVDAHQGRIEFDSEIGRGSRFSVYLPANPLPEERLRSA